MDEFQFPKIHSFPPMYTKQPNSTILQNQLDSWSDLILSYCQYYKITRLSLTGSILYSQHEDLNVDKLPPLFDNTYINRSVNDEFKSSIFQHMIHKLHVADYLNSKRPEAGIFIYWRSLSEWGNILYDYVEKTGQLGSVLTVYELTKLEDSVLNDSLKNLDYELLERVLKKVLVKQGKAQVLMNEEGTQIGGVKIV